MLVPASVQDKKAHRHRLKVGDFQLKDEKVPQTIKYFSVENDEPVSIAFVLDVRQHASAASWTLPRKPSGSFVDQLRPKDRFALICFADEQVSWVTPFTSDRTNFLDRLSVQEGYGQTALNDAVAATPKLVDEQTNGRKAIVLITDGVDNASRLSAHDAVTTARQVEVPIYTVGFTTLPWEDKKKSQDFRNEYVRPAALRGPDRGDMFVVQDPDELKEAVDHISTNLRHQYLIGYSPV